MKIPHPVQYQGSKRNLAPLILQHFPAQIERLIEPFAGTGAVSVACAAAGRAERYWLNDCNKPLAELLQLIINQPNALADFYKTLWHEQLADSEGHYYTVREKFNQTGSPQLFLYLLSRCVKGAVRYNSEGEFNQSPDKRRNGAKPETMRKNICGVSALLNGRTAVSWLHYQEMLADINETDLVYMDPPYQGVCGERDSRYCSGINHDEFVDFLHELNKKEVSYLISYDGRCGSRTYGKELPDSLRLKKMEIEAGRSSQATLLGKKELTCESLYLSETLLQIKDAEQPQKCKRPHWGQLPLFEQKKAHVRL
ncbi:DNA adenine methylase [Desulfobulbus sp. F5]|nr:DNA adenine methylase [Desulfobulbus sp. F5]